ncbi:MAG: 1-deoxy-D-xylulose-5-phosphate synthase [Paludibacteraceae bacterium]|nr:1-deoxy-D-xylulose-5-phosphate synthase [Paludibacteraceae bacterium]
MEYQYLDHIVYPRDLKALPESALPQVCAELRDFIIRELSHNPGHLGSSLGTVELTVALHYVFDTPDDRIVWDVGHQAYGHKILTGRRERFHTNRQFKGLAPFPTPQESEYDAFVAGHASNSISAALGMDVAQRIGQQAQDPTPKSRHIVAVIGDGAMTGGLAFEGLNNTSMDKNDLLIVLNDNNMAIDPLRGGFTQYLVDLTTSPGYNRIRWWLYRLMVRLHLMSDRKKQNVQRFNNSLKALFSRQPQNIFQGLNIRYFGPVDGHNVQDLVRILREIKDFRGPKVLHIITKKGKGYAQAENNPTVWHAPGEFNIETGERVQHGCGPVQPLWQEVFGQTLLELAQQNPRIVGVTPAMPSGCSMSIMQQALPDRVFDVGIAEGHAVTFSAGMAKEGVLPYCNIYSSFLQRAYDNIIHDVALPRQHVVLCIDRAGIVGNDGATHHGLFDLAYLRPIPNLTIGAPRTADDLRAMMRIAQDIDGPIAIRYPRGRTAPTTPEQAELSRHTRCGKGLLLHQGDQVAVLSIGAIGNTVAAAITRLGEQGRHYAHYDMQWLKPIDTALLDEVGQHFKHVVTVEDGVIQGGLGSAVLEYFADKGYSARVTRLGIDNRFVEHGSTQELYHLLRLDEEGLCESLLQVPAM